MIFLKGNGLRIMKFTIDIGGETLERVAWTGGSVPSEKVKRTNSRFRRLRQFYFREVVGMCGGLDLWVCTGNSPLDRARIFWNQANLDAWATIRNHDRKSDTDNEDVRPTNLGD